MLEMIADIHIVQDGTTEVFVLYVTGEYTQRKNCIT